jgi:uncharacterized protein YdhG (YjbR/CyaY superfamily)
MRFETGDVFMASKKRIVSKVERDSGSKKQRPQKKTLVAGRVGQPAVPQTIDEYIAQCPASVRAILKKVRTTICRAAPEAQECISYRMPAFKLNGIVVYFAAWKEHIGLYPPIAGDASMEKAVARYAGPKGNLQFPLDEPMPYELIERIVAFRVKQNAARVAAKRKKRT